MHNRRLRIPLIIAVVLLAAIPLTSQTVVNRIHLGNVVEDATYVSSGPYAKQLLFIDGYNVMGFPNGAKTSVRPRVLFTTTQLPNRAVAPRGFAYIPETQRFVFTDNQDPYTLYFTDVVGNFLGPLALEWPVDFAPLYVESIRWVPSTDSTFPGKYLLSVSDDLGGHVAVISGFGIVEHIITPSTGPGYLTALEYAAPNRIYFGVSDDDTVNVMDLNGTVTKTVGNGYVDVEGIALVDGKTLFAISNGSGKLVAFEPTLNRIAARDRDFSEGFGICQIRGLGWNADEFRFVAWGVNTTTPLLNYGLFSFSPLGLSFSTIKDFGNVLPRLGPVTYLSNEHLIGAMANGTPRGFTFFTNAGESAGGFTIEDGAFSAPVTYIAPFGQLAMRSRGGAAIRIVNAQTGLTDRFIDVSALEMSNFAGLAYFNPAHPSGGQFLVFDAPARMAYILDFDGNVLSSFDTVAALDLYWPAALTAMPIFGSCGLFATYDMNRNEIVEFAMPCSNAGE